MKKTILFASMAALGLSAVAQGVDPKQFDVKEGYQLESIWLTTAGDGVTAVAPELWKSLKFDNAVKATMATMANGEVYISCCQTMVQLPGAEIETLEHLGHVLVLDAKTGAFKRNMNLTLNGEHYGSLIGNNCIGTDDFGHVYITPYVDPTYKIDDATGQEIVKGIPLYLMNPENGELTLINKFELDETEGPEVGGRVDFTDVVGDITREKARCVFMAIPNDMIAVTAWCCEQGSDEWLTGVNGEEDQYCGIRPVETYPADQTAWNYSPIVSIVRDADFSGSLFYTDGHTTQPALYDESGEMLETLKEHMTSDENDPWYAFKPTNQPNGVRQFGLNGQQFLAYAMEFPNAGTWGGHISIVKLDENESLENATPMWVTSPLGTQKGEGRFAHGIVASPEYTDANGKKAIDIMLYKDVNGVGVYRLAEEGFQNGVTDMVADQVEGAVKYFNLNGVQVNEAELSAGLYISLQGGVAKKVVIK